MATNHSFSAEIPELMGLIINSIYSKKEIFLRELISNASDALDKIKYESLLNNNLLQDNPNMKIRIIPNKSEKTITIEDDGIGMTKDDLINNLGTIAKSGTKNFLKAVKENDNSLDMNMIGQFGVGFYSAYLVSDKVTVITKHIDDKEYIWTSDAKSSFTIDESSEPILKRGTRIICHLKDDADEFLDENRLKEIIKTHSQYVSFPIELYVEKEIEEEVEDSSNEEEEINADEKNVDIDVDDEVNVEDVEEFSDEKENSKKKTIKKTVNEWELLNKQKPIWTRNPKDITDEEYKEFYKTIGNSWEECEYYKHFSVEGSLNLNGLLYIPKSQPFDMFQSNKDIKNIKLYVKRVFITDDCKELVPEWLSFIKGVIDSNDLTLNVSRELLQQGRTLRLIKKQIVKKALDMFAEIAEDEKQYLEFYNNHQKFIKLGIHEDSENRDKLSKFLRFNSLKSQEDKISLDKYIENMKEGIDKIFYISGESVQSVINSPFLEKLKKDGHDVLLLTDPIDEYLVQQLKKYGEKELISVSSNDFKLDTETEDIKKYEEEFKDLCEKFKEQLSDSVKDVTVSTRVVDSPCCLVTDSQSYSANMQRIMKAQAMGNNSMMDYMMGKASMEINPTNKIIIALKDRLAKDSKDHVISDLVSLLYEMSLLTSGFTLKDPSQFANKFSKMLALGLSIEDNEDDEDDDDIKDILPLTTDLDEIEEGSNMEQVD